ncbi:MAG: pyruvate, phosphate dikinase [Actinomycetota bacterium]|nr:pyruvate, phosphate dikinase [Actinomycetota bacterium]
MAQWVFDFSEGDASQKNLLGGKGANLAEMTNLGLPVPPGFTITTEACNAYRKGGGFPNGLLDEVAEHRKVLEEEMGRELGNAKDPLLVSVRSGAPFSMPGMMDTVLNVGLNDDSVEGLADQTGSDRFAWDSYRRLAQMFGKTVLGIDGDLFEEELESAKEKKGVKNDIDLDEKDLRKLVKTFKKIIKKETHRDFPQDPTEQLHLAIEAVFKSWDNKRARDYRTRNKISDDLGTAVNVQAMVFGNRGDDSGTGVAFTRDPATGEKKPYGDYLPNAQGEDVVAGIRNTLQLHEMGSAQPRAWAELQEHMGTLERHFKDMCDIEFTVEEGKLWLLQTRVGKRTARAEWEIAWDMAEEGLIDDETAVRDRLTADRLDELFKPSIRGDLKHSVVPVAKGLNASPGAAVGRVVFTADDAFERAQRDLSDDAPEWIAGEKDGRKAKEMVILVRRETTPDDYHGMVASQGILTSAGGTNSHAAVVARGEGIPAVCGADSIRIDRAAKEFMVGETTVKEGDWITIDGTDGTVYAQALETEPSALEQAMKGRKRAQKSSLWRSHLRFMRLADENRRLRVRANADTPEQAKNARMRGAEGIGLCRTEHMFMGEERLASVRQMIFAANEEEEREAYKALLPLQRKDFVGIFKAMDGLPVTVRLLDPPLHEFLPDRVELAVEVATGTIVDEKTKKDRKLKKAELEERKRLLAKVNELSEANPMLGLRGVRLGIVKTGLYEMQVRAIVEAAVRLKKRGLDPRPEIMIPLVATAEELHRMRYLLEPVAQEVIEKAKVELDVPFGTMIELPRAAVSAADIAAHADFFSFGTNDLTQTTYGFSRDDIGKFLAMYEELKLVGYNPFVSIDEVGVGRLMELAVEEGRKSNGHLHLGICGEHGGDPQSITFCERLQLDYVSCSPFRVPTARLAAGQAIMGEARSTSK